MWTVDKKGEFQGWNSSYLLFSFERQQSLVQEQLAKLAQRERESAASKGLDELSPAFITEKEKADREREKNNMLVRDMFSFPCRPHNNWSAATWNDRKTFCISFAINAGTSCLLCSLVLIGDSYSSLCFSLLWILKELLQAHFAPCSLSLIRPGLSGFDLPVRFNQ